MEICKMKKLKDLLKESFVWERQFGEKLPTLDSVQKKKNEGKLDEGKYFQKWQEHLRNLDKLYMSVHHAKKAIPHKKKELMKIEKHYKELHKLVDIIVGQSVDM